MTDLETFNGFAALVASERADPSRWDDARQEGLIAGWQASLRDADNPRSYMIAACKNRVAGYLSGRAPFGHAGRRGWQEVEADLLYEGEDHGTPDPAFERVEVREAVAGLPEAHRELVFRKFWLGEPFSRWDRPVFEAEIRPALREALAA